MKQKKILLIFQNAYSGRGRVLKLNKAVYGTDAINRKNATYSRVIPHLEPHFNISITECTPMVATNSKDKFPTDLKWMKRAIDHDKWDLVIAFGSQAHQAIQDLGITDAELLPHPVSYKWRKQLILDIVEKHTTITEEI